MEQPDKIRLDIVNKIRCRQIDSDSSSSESDEEPGFEDSFGTSHTGTGIIVTPRSSDSSAVTSPRANLLWDHGFDVADNEEGASCGRDGEWRRFRNKTDDDKLIADKRMKIQEIAQKLNELNDKNNMASQSLPDLIPLASVSSSKRSSQETLYELDDLDLPPPLPESDPPDIDFSDLPPPLPASSPPQLNVLNENESNGDGEILVLNNGDCGDETSETGDNDIVENVDYDSDDTSELCNENPLGYNTNSEDSSSAAGDISDQDLDKREANYDGFYNVKTHTIFKMEGDEDKSVLRKDLMDDFEAEFDSLLQSFDADTELQETYIERFSGRRDRYGFILSPVIEAPSPTPSNMSGYSGYSGISCSSPDPFGVFRMSPGPSRGSKQDIDLTSLCVKSSEWDLQNDQTVPIYQTVLAKRAIAIPDGYGWDSGDDLLSPTGSVEWDCSNNGLSTPPVSTNLVNLTQFGTHISGWKHPDVAIYEEPENYESDVTVEDTDTSDTDTTLDEASSENESEYTSDIVVKECDSPEKHLYVQEKDEYLNESVNEIETNEMPQKLDDSIQSIELSVLEEEIRKVENELKMFKEQTRQSKTFTEKKEEELKEIVSKVLNTSTESVTDVRPNTDSLDDSFQGFSGEIAEINRRDEKCYEVQNLDTSEQTESLDSSLEGEKELLSESLELRCRNPIPVLNLHNHSTTDEDSDSSESYEDAEDEYSDSENVNEGDENKESDSDLFRVRKYNGFQNDKSRIGTDAVLVSELLTPRTGILKSGGMNPEDSDSSSLTSDDDVPDENMSSYGSGIKISQYTSGDSDDNGLRNDNFTSKINTNTKITEREDSGQNSKQLQENVNCNEQSLKPLKIQSPLDFSVLDSKFEVINKSDWRKSPKIFGRYYEEMDDDLLEEVRSKCDSVETPRSEPELPDSLTGNQDLSSLKQRSTTDIDDYENSFKSVEISDSSAANIKSEHSYQQEQKNGDTPSFIKNNESVHEFDEDLQVIQDEADSIITTSFTNCSSKSYKADINNGHHSTAKKSSKQSSPKGSKPETLKIKISHLGRRGSAGSKIKHGFVHELSELFDKGLSEKEDNSVYSKKTYKSKETKTQRPQTPKIFTPKENVVIFEKETETNVDEDDNPAEESLGFEVTPLQRVQSFERIPNSEREKSASDEEDSDVENYDYFADEKTFEDSDDSSDEELQMYENQLRERENNSLSYGYQSKGEATLLEDDYNYDKEETGDTTEFIPELDTLADISSPLDRLRDEEKEVTSTINTTKTNEEDEIEEYIEGDTDSYPSEDEEFHDKYFLPGHSYHINRAQHSNSQSNDLRTNKVHDTYKLSADFIRPEHQIIIEDAEIQNSENKSDLIEERQLGVPSNIKAVDDRSEEHNCVKHNKNLQKKVEDECPETIKRQDTTCKGLEKSHIDMSNILWNIPKKALKVNKRDKNAEKSQKTPAEKSKHSGYLYDLLSRINITPRSKKTKSNNHPIVSTTVKREQCLSNDSELKVEIIDKEENIENQIVKPKSPSQLQQSLALPVRHCENSEYKNSMENDRDKEIRTNYGKRKRHIYDFEEDPKFKIRYPASLSRPLYESHCRLRARQENDQREVNPPGLTDSISYSQIMGDGDKSVLLRLSRELNIQRNLNEDENENITVRSQRNTCYASDIDLPSTDSNLRHSPMTNDKAADNSSIHAEEQNSNPDHFNHTSYTVKTPFSTITQHDGIKFNLKPIIDSERNQAEQNTPLSENNFVNVNLKHRGDEAKSDKQETDLKATFHYGNRNYDVNFTKLPMHLECKSLNNKRVYEKREEINRNNLGGDVNSVPVKNDDRYTAMGVHIPLELSANETKRENVDMNNDSMSTSYKLDSVETNIPRINNTSSSVTTQNINSYPMSSGDTDADDKPVSDEEADSPEAEETHISRASVVLRSPGVQHVLEDEKGKLKLWPYSDFDNSDKLPVTLHRVKKRINLPGTKGMSHRSSNMTVIQSAEHSAEMPMDRVVQKYQSSSVLPGDRTADQIMKAHGESVQSVILQDGNANNVSEEELAAVLPKIANSISIMENSNAEEILPGITQSITKLKNGGNLVITTMTRKLDEEESSSSGRGSPEPEPDYPVLNVDDLENSKIYLVQDSKGEMFYVEDVTSESQESAYFSSRNTSESVSEPGNSPIFDRISKINSVGESGIKQSTAQEILSAMYGDSDVKELNENEEEWSERTYEYDIPRRRDSGARKEYSKDSFNTSYMVEEPGDTMPKLKSATSKDRYESSYQTAGGSPWVYDGGMSQSYSQMTHANYPGDSNSVVAVSTQNVDNSGVKTIERYTIEGEAIDYPAPQPMFVPPMVVQTDLPQYSMVKVDVTPKYKEESVQARIEPPKPEEPVERPIYKTVATITTPEKVPSPKPVEQKKYKILKSKATKTQEEEQETHMRFDEIDYKFSAENVEYTMRPATTDTQYFIKNTSNIQPQSQFRTEKRIELGRNSDQKFKSQIQVQEPQKEVYEQSSYSYDQMKSELEQSESNMRVVRGSYLIKNTLDNAGEEFDDNINMFDGNFNMYKDNPLYKSDEDLYKRLERERLESARRLRLQRDQDLAFETTDRFKKSKTVQREPEKPRQSIYELLMSRLSTIDKQHIKQTIDVKHDHEDIFGDPRFMQADGQYIQNVSATNDFDTVGEKVDLLLKEGKAFITVRVTAERITPVDLEFNVWRKNQAIVTRTIEVDLLATEKRRQLYYKVMQEPAKGSHAEYRVGPNETILDSKETLELFSSILGAADGEGDTEDIEVKTRSGKTTTPFLTGMDLLY